MDSVLNDMFINTKSTPENTSHLVEHGMRYFMSNTLHKCAKKKMEYSYLVTNIIYFGLLLFVFIGILIFKRYNRETPQQLNNRINEKESYLYTKMQIYNQQSRKVDDGMITDIPVW